VAISAANANLAASGPSGTYAGGATTNLPM
jgi:hypothetical protein